MALENRILIVCDDSLETDLLRELLLEIEAEHVDWIGSLDTSLTSLVKLSYSCAILDTKQRIEVLEKIRRVNPMMSVVVISSEPSVEEAVEAIQKGAAHYFRRPFNPQSLQLVVKKTLSKKGQTLDNSDSAKFLRLFQVCHALSVCDEPTHFVRLISQYLSSELHSPIVRVFEQLTEESMPEKFIFEGSDESNQPDEQRVLDDLLNVTLEVLKPFSQFEKGQVQKTINKGLLTPALFVCRFKMGTQKYLSFVVLSPEMAELGDEFELRVRMLKSQVEAAGEVFEKLSGFKSLVWIDEVTGLNNTRYLDRILDREIENYAVKQQSFSVLFVDIDHFKKVNDQHGHRIGTELLKKLAEKLKKSLRESDLVFRYGGDEFIAILPQSDISSSFGAAERIRRMVEETIFEAEGGLRLKITVSIGVSVFGLHALSKNEILEAADKAMYGAKITSRNSVVVSGTEAPMGLTLQ